MSGIRSVGERSTLRFRANRSLAGVQELLQRLSEVQRQMATQRRIAVPSDAPADADRIIGFDEQLALAAAHERNISDARARLDATDGALAKAGDIMLRIKELAVQSANGTYTAADRQRIAAEVRELKEAFTSVANTRFGSDRLFSGFRVDTVPYPSSDPVSPYAGDRGVILREVGPGAKVQVNVVGEDAFSEGRVAIQDLLTHLLANDTAALSADIDAVDTAQAAVLDQRSLVGARLSRVDQAQSALEERRAGIEDLRSGLADIDMAEAVTRLSRLEVNLQASLETTARVLSISIFDYLR